MTERISRFERIDKTMFNDSRYNYQLTLLGTSAMENGRKLKRKAQPLFRGESPGFVNLIAPSCRDAYWDITTHSDRRNVMPITTQADAFAETPQQRWEYIRRKT